MDNPIVVKNLTKDYGKGRGIYNINFEIKKGEMLGFVGTNGSGKTTTIRCLLGYIKPTNGSCFVLNKESWKYSSDIAKHVGYVPGEIGFPDLPTGKSFLKTQAEYFKIKDLSYAENIMKELQLDPRANLKRMSKGMKQKTALVACLMNDAEILILDEPTTGLDPLMRIAFINIIKREHKKGKTILMSSHMFNEVEDTCDRVAFISDGKLIDIADMNKIRNRKEKDYKIEFTNKEDYLTFKNLKYNIIRDQEKYNQVTINISNNKINKLFKDLSKFELKFLSEVKFSLEKYFKQVVNKEEKNKNV